MFLNRFSTLQTAAASGQLAAAWRSVSTNSVRPDCGCMRYIS